MKKQCFALLFALVPFTALAVESHVHLDEMNPDLQDKASLQNERNAIWLRTHDGRDVTCVQVAGLIARRILCYVGSGAELSRGQRFGFIRFGSRVDLYLPLDAEVTAAIGEKVYAAQTVVARLRRHG